MGLEFTLDAMLRFIARLPSAAPNLELLTISIPELGEETWRTQTIPPSSDTVDDALMKLPNLREMCFCVGCEATEFEGRLSAKLPRTIAAGLFSFSTIESEQQWNTTTYFP
jgi:hypothetical protein